jgi:hypothetical protein
MDSSLSVGCVLYSLRVLIIAFSSNRIHSILMHLLPIIFISRSTLDLFNAIALPLKHVQSYFCIMHSCVELFRSELWALVESPDVPQENAITRAKVTCTVR